MKINITNVKVNNLRTAMIPKKIIVHVPNKAETCLYGCYMPFVSYNSSGRYN